MKSIDEIYHDIAQSIVATIENDNWTAAQLHIEVVGEGVVGYTGQYTIGTEKHDIAVRKLPREIRNWIRELHEITTEGGNNKWNRAIFKLTSSGKFEMEFNQDEALQDEIERLSKT